MTYGFDAEQVMVWIDSFDRIVPGQAGVLCRRHANAMVVPLGWMLDDRRGHIEESQSGAIADEELDGDSGEHVGLDGAPDVHAETAADTAEPVETAAAPWKPTFDQTDDLDGLLEARSPLLARAFGGHDRRRPVR